MEKINLITIKDSRSPISEAFRTLRTNIQYSSVDKKIQVIVVTSSGPKEGKSTTSANLAVVMAQSGFRTVLIDCDQRKPTIHKIFQISNFRGISDTLAGRSSYEEILQKTNIENLFIITTGTKPPNPSELLASQKMQTFIEELKEQFEYIILDTPPVLMVTDAQLLSRYADGVVFVISSSEVERDAAIRAKELLEKVNAKILGVVLNKVKTSAREYYGRYNYYYSSDLEDKKAR
ncbi:MAG: CpsD/CapB family tyrosine-protein kinase [Clostridiaceae bacterium]